MQNTVLARARVWSKKVSVLLEFASYNENVNVAVETNDGKTHQATISGFHLADVIATLVLSKGAEHVEGLPEFCQCSKCSDVSGAWIVITGWCPRCWWTCEASFHRTVSRSAVLRYMTAQHRDSGRNCKPDCPTCGPRYEKAVDIRIEGLPACQT